MFGLLSLELAAYFGTSIFSRTMFFAMYASVAAALLGVRVCSGSG